MEELSEFTECCDQEECGRPTKVIFPIGFFLVHTVQKGTHQLISVRETTVGKEEDLLSGLSQAIKDEGKLGSTLNQLINHLNSLVLQLAIVVHGIDCLADIMEEVGEGDIDFVTVDTIRLELSAASINLGLILVVHNQVGEKTSVHQIEQSVHHEKATSNLIRRHLCGRVHFASLFSSQVGTTMHNMVDVTEGINLEEIAQLGIHKKTTNREAGVILQFTNFLWVTHGNEVLHRQIVSDLLEERGIVNSQSVIHID